MCLYLIFVPLNGFGNRHEATVNVSIQTGLVSIEAGEGELGNERDGS